MTLRDLIRRPSIVAAVMMVAMASARAEAQAPAIAEAPAPAPAVAAVPAPAPAPGLAKIEVFPPDINLETMDYVFELLQEHGNYPL